MICPKCGGRMNLHAEKLTYNEALELELFQMHGCPRCGNSESRLAGSLPETE